MKISNKPPEDQGPDRPKPKIARKAIAPTSPEKTGHAQRTPPAREDSVWGKEREMVDIMASVNELPDVREQKVLNIKKAVDSGTYIIDARKVADGILKDL